MSHPDGSAKWRSIAPLQWLASLVYTGLLFASSPAWGAVITLVGWLPLRLLYPFARGWARSNLWFAKVLCGLDWVLEGRENIPREGAHITMWKHTSAWETMAQMVVFPPSAWVYKREILWIPLVGWATWMMPGIAIDRGAGHRAVNQILEQGRARLAAGIWVMIFPEGTRVGPGETRKYGMSGALLAAQTGVKLIPVAHNAGDFWPRRGLLKKPGKIRVVIGPPVETAGREPRDLNAEVQRWIEGKMREISAAPDPQTSRLVT
ncbi:MAG: lysophospholipid acyltransferase family protein [Steroidobacteraceae bacterium]